MTHDEVVKWWWQRYDGEHTINLKDMTDEIAYDTYQALMGGISPSEYNDAIGRAEKAEKECKEKTDRINEIRSGWKKELDENLELTAENNRLKAQIAELEEKATSSAIYDVIMMAEKYGAAETSAVVKHKGYKITITAEKE